MIHRIKKFKILLLLALVLFFALFVRLYDLQKVPVGFHYDEAQIGYNAYSLLKTGHDKNNVFLPLAIDQFGDFRPAGYHYLAIPFIATLGLNEFATRLPGALFGAFSIIPMFFLSKKLFKSKAVGLISSALLAIVPWHVVTSRATSESIIAMFFVLSGSSLLVYYLDNKKIKFLLISYFLFALSFFFYHSARFFVPAFLISTNFFIFLTKDLQSKFVKKSLVVSNLILILFLVLLLYVSKGAVRPANISIFSTPETNLKLSEQIREDGGQSTFITRFFHNKVINYAYTFSSNYSDHMTARFLFLEGGLPPRYTVVQNGLIYPSLALFVILGLSFLLIELIQKKSFRSIFILLWLILGPVPAALSYEDLPNIQRSIMMLPALVLIIAFGIMKMSESISSEKFKMLIAGVFVILLSYNAMFFFHNYFQHSFTHRSWYRSVGEGKLIKKVDELSKGKRITIMTRSNENYLIFFLFYQKIDPAYYISSGSPRGKTRFKNLVFVDDECPLSDSLKYVDNKEAIYVNSGNCRTPEYARELASIVRTDGTKAFTLLEVKDNMRASIKK